MPNENCLNDDDDDQEQADLESMAREVEEDRKRGLKVGVISEETRKHLNLPPANKNTNCLENYKCPKCGGTDRFSITAMVTAEVVDNGVENTSDFDWNHDSTCECRCSDGAEDIDCDFGGIVADFIPKEFGGQYEDTKAEIES